MTEQQNKILRGLGIIFLFAAAFLLILDFGNNNWPSRIVRYALLFLGIYLFHIASKDTQPIENKSEIGPYGVMFLCAPTILSVLAIIVAHFFQPGPHVPLATMTDRFFANLVVASVPIALLGIPLVAWAIVKGVSLIWREGLRSSTSKFVILILVIAISASSYMITQSVEYRGQYKHEAKP